MSGVTLAELSIQETLKQYWNELPLIKKIDREKDFQFLTNDNRAKIISVLSKGKKDTENNKEFIRHALTVQEIQAQIKEQFKYDITETNTHFHIQKLIDKGFIQEVLEIKTGRRPKKFFGRTAKIFLSSGESPKVNIEDDDFTKRLIDLIARINPKLKKEDLLPKFEDMFRKKTELGMEKIGDWMEKNNSQILESEIEFKELFLYINKALTYNNEFIKFYSDVLEMLKYSH